MKWISVKDKRPKDYQWIILYVTPSEYNRMEDPHVFVGMWNTDYYKSAHGDGWTPFQNEEITHWMPLPQPPEVKNEMD